MRAEYCAWPICRRETSLQVTFCRRGSAPSPRTSISPMWLTSNSPTRVRTAMCSGTIPEYSTGMSQPPNSTMRAPMRRWAWFNAVLRSAAVGEANFSNLTQMKKRKSKLTHGGKSSQGNLWFGTRDSRLETRRIRAGQGPAIWGTGQRDAGAAAATTGRGRTDPSSPFAFSSTKRRQHVVSSRDETLARGLSSLEQNCFDALRGTLLLSIVKVPLGVQPDPSRRLSIRSVH